MVESNQNQDSNLASRLQQDLKNDLIAGLLVVIPLATTIWLSSLVSKFVLTLVTSVPKQLNPFITLNPLLQDLINLTLGLTVFTYLRYVFFINSNYLLVYPRKNNF